MERSADRLLRRCTRPITNVYSWGRCDFGQLGVNKILEASEPSLVQDMFGKYVVHVAAGEYHTAYLTDEGVLYTVGNNEYGQLGFSSTDSQSTPSRVAALDTSTIVHVACGTSHTVAVTDGGTLASWGSNEFGQLGVGTPNSPLGSIPVKNFRPRLVKGSRDLKFVRVACGANHTLALTVGGEVYAFGQGSFGSLGVQNIDCCYYPIHVSTLWGLGIVQVACGENHSAALAVNGRVYTWGRGKYGQLGHGSTANERVPAVVAGEIETESVVQISCGGDHTMAVTSSGQLFTWGRGHWGQTGLNTTDDVLAPKRVSGLESVVQVSGGARHSMAVTSDSIIYGWGDCEQLQLGKMDREMYLEPVRIKGLPPLFGSSCGVFAVGGGEHSVAVFLDDGAIVFSGTEQTDQISTKQSDRLMVNISDALESGTGVDSKMGREEPQADGSEPVSASPEPFSSALSRKRSSDEISASRVSRQPGTVHGTGLKPVPVPDVRALLAESKKLGEAVPNFGSAIDTVFSSAAFLLLQFKLPGSSLGDNLELGLDVNGIRTFYLQLFELYNVAIIERLARSMARLLEGLEDVMMAKEDFNAIRVVLIIFQCPFLGDKGVADQVCIRLFNIMAWLSDEVKARLSIWFQTYPREIFGGRFLLCLQRYITNRDHQLNQEIIPATVVSALKVMQILYHANESHSIVPNSEFYNSSVSTKLDLQYEYAKWRKSKSTEIISFCQMPFILTPEAKSRILQGEAALIKNQQVQNTLWQAIANPVVTPILILHVRRQFLIQDTVTSLERQYSDLRKPLKVVFDGEEGIDEGGVTKEFFQILTRDLFNVSYGMFAYNEDTRKFWFSSHSLASDHEFQLVGIILGLAIYNGAILDIHFPQAVYKKILGKAVGLPDLQDVQPQTAQSLHQLLEYEGNVQETFSQYFEVEYEYFGEIRKQELLPGGGMIPVTELNRIDFVNCYVDYILNSSIKTQFEAFDKGFKMVCGGMALNIFRHDELELLICGLPHYDFEALERVVKYDGGYTRESQVIRWFWEVVHGMSLADKKKLLAFTTGNDRSPIGGLGTLKLVITRNGSDTDRLPTSHTCFNVLLLPDYTSKSKLEDRLHIAIQNATGFGLQ